MKLTWPLPCFPKAAILFFHCESHLRLARHMASLISYYSLMFRLGLYYMLVFQETDSEIYVQNGEWRRKDWAKEN